MLMRKYLAVVIHRDYYKERNFRGLNVSVACRSLHGRHHFAGDGLCSILLTPPPKESDSSHDLIYSKSCLVVDSSIRTEVDNY